MLDSVPYDIDWFDITNWQTHAGFTTDQGTKYRIVFIRNLPNIWAIEILVNNSLDSVAPTQATTLKTLATVRKSLCDFRNIKNPQYLLGNSTYTPLASFVATWLTPARLSEEGFELVSPDLYSTLPFDLQELVSKIGDNSTGWFVKNLRYINI